MDYGQNGQRDDRRTFFTEGVGFSSPEQNPLGPEDNLDITSQDSWGQNRDFHNIGNRAIFSAESLESPSSQEMSPNPQGLGEIIDLTPPPTLTADFTSSPAQETFIPKAIRTEGDHLSKDTMTEIKKVEEKLNQTGDIAGFYASIRGSEHTPGMLRNNLKNSYNREVA